MSDPLPWIAFAGTTGLGGFGLWLTKRKDRTDAGSTLVSMGLQIAQRADAERLEADQEKDRLKVEIADMKLQLKEHAEKIRACEGDRELLIAIAVKAGWDLKDIRP